MSRKKSVIITISFLILLKFFAFAGICNAAEVSELTWSINNNELYVSTMIRPDQKIMNDLSDGLSKEFIFYIDLFRVWDIWPDEFVLGTKITANLKSDPIKREYFAASSNGSMIREKRFNDLEAMVNWATTLAGIKLTNIRELEAGNYFIKVTAESRIRTLPPVIGYLLFFVSDKEFSVSRNSNTFRINTKGVQP